MSAATGGRWRVKLQPQTTLSKAQSRTPSPSSASSSPSPPLPQHTAWFCVFGDEFGDATMDAAMQLRRRVEQQLRTTVDDSVRLVCMYGAQPTLLGSFQRTLSPTVRLRLSADERRAYAEQLQYALVSALDCCQTAPPLQRMARCMNVAADDGDDEQFVVGVQRGHVYYAVVRASDNDDDDDEDDDGRALRDAARDAFMRGDADDGSDALPFVTCYVESARFPYCASSQ
jgi:hypothetical protein